MEIKFLHALIVVLKSKSSTGHTELLDHWLITFPNVRGQVNGVPGGALSPHHWHQQFWRPDSLKLNGLWCLELHRIGISEQSSSTFPCLGNSHTFGRSRNGAFTARAATAGHGCLPPFSPSLTKKPSAGLGFVSTENVCMSLIHRMKQVSAYHMYRWKPGLSDEQPQDTSIASRGPPLEEGRRRKTKFNPDKVFEDKFHLLII